MSYVSDAATPFVQWDGSVEVLPHDYVRQRLHAILPAYDRVAAMRAGQPGDETGPLPVGLLNDTIVCGARLGASSHG